MKKIKNIALIGMIAAGALCSSCSEDFLKPDPLSFYEPEQPLLLKPDCALL